MNIEDYKAIKDFYFVKEISCEQYNSGEYHVETPKFSDIKFAHSETRLYHKVLLANRKGTLALLSVMCIIQVRIIFISPKR